MPGTSKIDLAATDNVNFFITIVGKISKDPDHNPRTISRNVSNLSRTQRSNNGLINLLAKATYAYTRLAIPSNTCSSPQTIPRMKEKKPCSIPSAAFATRRDTPLRAGKKKREETQFYIFFFQRSRFLLRRPAKTLSSGLSNLLPSRRSCAFLYTRGCPYRQRGRVHARYREITRTHAIMKTSRRRASAIITGSQPYNLLKA